jgi:hypothetical protein
MQVAFSKPSEKHRLCQWTAVRGKRTVVPGSVMAAGRDLPHDLGQYVVEAALGIRNGFWGLIARGATFKSTGRRVTLPGRALIVAHGDDLAEAERLAGVHVDRWRRHLSTPTGLYLAVALEAWERLGVGDRLVFAWPEPTGVIEPQAGRSAWRPAAVGARPPPMQ